MIRRKRFVENWRSGRWRLAILEAVRSWNRNQVGRIFGAVILTWLLGSVALHLAERNAEKSEFSSWPEALWGSGSSSSAAWIRPRRRWPGA